MTESMRHAPRAMRTRFIQVVLVIFSLIYGTLVVTVFTADRLYSSTFNHVNESEILEDAIERLDYAIRIDPLNAELYFRKCELLRKIRKINGDKKPYAGELQLLQECIQLRPFWPKYHFFYGVILSKMSQYPNVLTQELIISELRKAAELKPYSEFYQNTYYKYITRLNRANRKRYLNQTRRREPSTQQAILNRVHQKESGLQETSTGTTPVIARPSGLKQSQ